jgi:hypothetical protein
LSNGIHIQISFLVLSFPADFNCPICYPIFFWSLDSSDYPIPSFIFHFRFSSPYHRASLSVCSVLLTSDNSLSYPSFHSRIRSNCISAKALSCLLSSCTSRTGARSTDLLFCYLAKMNWKFCYLLGYDPELKNQIAKFSIVCRLYCLFWKTDKQ